MFAIAFILPLSIGAPAEPPKFTVVNKCPPSFTVTNKITATDDQRYAWLVQSVEAGRAGIMVIGPHAELHEYIHQDRFPSGFKGFADGVYDCFPRDNPDGTRTAMMQMRKGLSQKASPLPAYIVSDNCTYL